MNRESGLYKNGKRWWLLVKPIVGENVPRSTGTEDLRLANRIAIMLSEFREDRALQPWLTRAASGVVTLSVLYDHRSRGTLDVLAAQLEAATVVDTDIDPLVEKWITEHLVGRSISEGLRRDYERQIRTFIPEGVRFPRSSFTEDTLKAILNGLTDARSKLPLTGSTKRRYIAPLRLFYRYARKRVAGDPIENPFEEADWLPENNPARTTHWDHATALKVLDDMSGAAQAKMTLIFGTGMELGASQELNDLHLREWKSRLVTAPGTKNESRRDRTVYVDRWAWERVAFLKAMLTQPMSEVELRNAFYEAQVRQGIILEPTKSKSGKKLWKTVNPHTIHDARHSYCYTRLLGDDGEPRQSVKFCSHQLGHGSEQMVMLIYGKCNMEERIKQLELAEAREEGRRQG